MNWLERARREIGGSIPSTTANRAEGSLLAASAALNSDSLMRLTASFDSNGSDQSDEIVDYEMLSEDFEERAAIIEYDGGMIRDEAERAAWTIVTRRHRFH